MYRPVRLEVFQAAEVAAGQRPCHDNGTDVNLDSEISISNEMKLVKKIKFIFYLLFSHGVWRRINKCYREAVLPATNGGFPLSSFIW
jgi:hypothetical protein